MYTISKIKSYKKMQNNGVKVHGMNAQHAKLIKHMNVAITVHKG